MSWIKATAALLPLLSAPALAGGPQLLDLLEAERQAYQAHVGPRVVDLTVNGARLGEHLLWTTPDGRVWLEAEGLDGRIIRADTVAELIEDAVGCGACIAVDRLGALTLSADAARASIQLHDRYASVRRVGRSVEGAFQGRPQGGASLRYGASTQWDEARDARSSFATLDASISLYHLGVLNSGWSYRNVDSVEDTVRGDSFLRIDWPRQRLALRLGDSYSQSGDIGGSVRYGGIKFGTDFTTAPGFITTPRYSFSGSAARPSTLSVYVNDRLQSVTDIPAGPYDVSDLSMGSDGSVRVVVENELGQQVLQDVDVFSAPGLLRVGLVDFVIDAGTLRLDEDTYDGDFASGNVRVGVTNTITLSAHAEVMDDHTLAGVGGVFGTVLGAISVSGLSGGQQDDTYYAWRATWNKPFYLRAATGRRLTFNMGGALYGTDGLRYLGSTQAYPDGHNGYVALTWRNAGLRVGYNEIYDQRFGDASVFWRPWHNTYVSLSGRKDYAQDDTSVYASVSVNFGGHTLTTAHADSNASARTDVRLNGRADAWRYSAGISHNDAVSDVYRLGVTHDGPRATVGYHGSYREGSGAVHAPYVRGAVAFDGLRPLLTRHLSADGAYVVVDAGVPGVGVIGGGVTGITGRSGKTAVPIPPFQDVRLRFDPSRMPEGYSLRVNESHVSAYRGQSASLAIDISFPGVLLEVEGFAPGDVLRINQRLIDYFRFGAYVDTLLPGANEFEFNGVSTTVYVPEFGAEVPQFYWVPGRDTLGVKPAVFSSYQR